MKKYQNMIKGLNDGQNFYFIKKSCLSRNPKNRVQTMISENYKTLAL